MSRFLNGCIAGLAMAAFSAGLAPANGKPRKAPAGTVLAEEAGSKEKCEAVPNRMFVENFVGTECIAYYASPPVAGSDLAVIYFNGDLSNEDLADKSVAPSFIASFSSTARIMSEKSGVRIIFIARPGTFGSSGNHALRGERREMFVMNAAVDTLKSRLGIKTIVVTGQSRGSQVAASLLTMRRTDIRCAVLGSGVLHAIEFEQRHARTKGRELNVDSLRSVLYDPGLYLSEVVKDPLRRILVLGDRADSITHFDLQERFANELKQLGHHALLLEIKALGREMHGATHMVLPAATLCAKGAPDKEIAWIVRPPEEKPAGREVPKPEPSSQIGPTLPQALSPARAPVRSFSDGADPMPVSRPRTGAL